MVQNKFTKYNNNNNNNAQEKALRTNLINFTAQLVEHRTGVAEVTGSNPVEALIFFRLFPSNCLRRLTIVLGLGSSRANHACQSRDF